VAPFVDAGARERERDATLSEGNWRATRRCRRGLAPPRIAARTARESQGGA